MKGFLRLAAGLAVLAAPIQAQCQALSYPAARKAEVVEQIFGVQVTDPYRWMEDARSKELVDWVAAQNALSSSYLRSLPLHGHFQKRITELWNYSKTQIPIVESGRLFYRHNSGLQLQSPIYMRAGKDGPRELALDPNVISPDGSVALADFRPSPDGRLLAYALAEGGADWRTVRVRDLAAGRDLPEELKWVRFSMLSWTRDGKGFFYSRFPEPPAGQALHAQLGAHALYYHRVGTPQSQDVLIHERPEMARRLISGWVPREGRYLLIRLSDGAGPVNRLYYVDLGDPQQPNVRAPMKPLVEDEGSEYTALGSLGPLVYVKTDENAPNRKIIAIDTRDPRRETWKTVVPEGKDAIRFVGFYAERFVVEYLSDVQSRLAVFDRNGQPQGEIPLPDAGSITGLGGQRSGYIFYEFTSPLYQPTVFAYDPRTRQNFPFEPPTAPLDAGRYETRRLFATSKDGTRVPFFVTARKDLKLDGTNPALLLGYGGYSISLLPIYRPQVVAWLELGGIWASANIRGGGEYGKDWHLAARAEKRQNAFDDFIAVAEHLVREKFTSPARLGIWGRSNGGLLVGVVSQQRPDLYAVVLPGVPVMDMLRFDRFTGGRAWIPEYGSPRNPEQFRHLLRYSPVHNVKAGTCYPATLVTSADHDDRVVPSHAFKFAAAVQAAQACPRPVLLRYEAKASHGYVPTERLIAEMADIWAFAAEHTGMRPAAVVTRTP
jgi:prolyl oligopeptidase